MCVSNQSRQGSLLIHCFQTSGGKRMEASLVGHIYQTERQEEIHKDMCIYFSLEERIILLFISIVRFVFVCLGIGVLEPWCFGVVLRSLVLVCQVVFFVRSVVLCCSSFFFAALVLYVIKVVAVVVVVMIWRHEKREDRKITRPGKDLYHNRYGTYA